MSCILSKFSNFCAQINDALTFNTEANKTTMIMLIGLSKNILPVHFYEDYKLDSNFMSCILSKFSNFCVQINDALIFNTKAKKNHNNNTHWPKQEHLTCTLLWVISIESRALLIP